jgi:hypothetical protein
MFLSVKGVTRDGVLTDADELEAEVKRAMIAQSEEAVLLLDDSKLGARGQNAIARVTEVTTVLAHGAPASALEPLRATGVDLKVVGRELGRKDRHAGLRDSRQRGVGGGRVGDDAGDVGEPDHRERRRGADLLRAGEHVGVGGAT